MNSNRETTITLTLPSELLAKARAAGLPIETIAVEAIRQHVSDLSPDSTKSDLQMPTWGQRAVALIGAFQTHEWGDPTLTDPVQALAAQRRKTQQERATHTRWHSDPE